MNRVESTSAADGGSVLPDKVDMSLDEIIRLNKREQQLKRRQANTTRRAGKKKGRVMSLPRTAGQAARGGSRYLSPLLRATGAWKGHGEVRQQRLGFLHKGGHITARGRGAAGGGGGAAAAGGGGGGAAAGGGGGGAAAAAGGGGGGGGGGPKLRNGRLPPFRGRRRGQGVMAGLAARRPTTLRKRSGTLNRTTVQQRTRQRTRPFVLRPDVPYRKPQAQRPPFIAAETHKAPNAAPLGRPFTLRRRTLPALQQSQKEARQATFVFRRGLKVQATLHKTAASPAAAPRRWRSPPPSGGSSGILTVSIDNPSARTQPEPPRAWTLHPPALSPTPVTMETVEKKIPKGVALQFDINSVSKPQTSMTLNERFRILKDQRSAVTPSGKGGRFVTVG